jgi:hypothetical protein
MPQIQVLLADSILERQEYAVTHGYELIEPEVPVIRRDLVVGEILIWTRTRGVEAADISTERYRPPIDSQSTPLVSEEAEAEPERTRDCGPFRRRKA